MTPNAALNVILAGHGATCASYALMCRRCEREHEATEVLRALIASVATEARVRAELQRSDPFEALMRFYDEGQRVEVYVGEGGYRYVESPSAYGYADDVDRAARSLCSTLGIDLPTATKEEPTDG